MGRTELMQPHSVEAAQTPEPLLLLRAHFSFIHQSQQQPVGTCHRKPSPGPPRARPSWAWRPPPCRRPPYAFTAASPSTFGPGWKLPALLEPGRCVLTLFLKTEPVPPLPVIRGRWASRPCLLKSRAALGAGPWLLPTREQRHSSPHRAAQKSEMASWG